jgi:hypothetical protein
MMKKDYLIYSEDQEPPPSKKQFGWDSYSRAVCVVYNIEDGAIYTYREITKNKHAIIPNQGLSISGPFDRKKFVYLRYAIGPVSDWTVEHNLARKRVSKETIALVLAAKAEMQKMAILPEKMVVQPAHPQEKLGKAFVRVSSI